jgi:hypothetical protein
MNVRQNKQLGENTGNEQTQKNRLGFPVVAILPKSGKMIGGKKQPES